ncbi:MAG: TSUP family transporter [Opitutae bacterium]|nr:TSUP family transporter [Opitutae bacterium]
MLLTLPTLSYWAYPLLFVAGGVAGLVDAMAGGGGLITVPVLLNLGLPAPLALGTNKLQASFGSVSAAMHYAQGRVVDLRECGLGIVCTAVGALAGSGCVQLLDAQALGKLIPWLLAAIVIYMVVRPKVGQHERPARMERRAFFVLFGLGLGFYDGFFGPGTGSFWTIALILLLGQDFLRATGYTKVMNATSNLTALAFFALNGQLVLDAGLTMAAGQFLGARIGAKLVMQRGSRFVQPVFFTMVVLVIARLLWVNYLR